MNADGSWRFAWYTFMIQNVDKMQTARYYITALDLGDPTQSATTSVMMKKPEFTVVASPNPLETGEYLQPPRDCRKREFRYPDRYYRQSRQGASYV